ncbi:MAG TPA: Xaa-Pro peptidase family protein [Candidatus Acidoferrum sp.]|nr:Xaa-Pro peptidase family protein [Candidatus Acidoferrum sp.]
MTTPFAQRRRALRKQLDEAELGALIVTQPASWYYLTGFTGEAGALILSAAGTTLITDSRFTEQARREAPGVRVVQQVRALPTAVGEFLKDAPKGRGRTSRKIGFPAAHLTVAQFRAIRRAAGPRVHWAPAEGFVERLRGRKDPQELAVMRRAAALADKVMAHAFTVLKPGVRELEVAAEIEYQMRQLGASGPAFETIVAFGERSAYPHARPTDKRLRKNELVVLDMGAILAHYCSDITRTVVVGKASPKVRGWHKAVQEARTAAVAAVRAGVTCGEVDAAARQVLAGHRLDRYFTHSTGHGLGIEVHEDPRVAKGQKQKLEPGNVITIEPGVYVPGVGGIRIEDDVAVHSGESEVLTRTPRDIIEI